MTPAEAAYLTTSIVSTVACAAALVSLLGGQRHNRHRLFWNQLVALTITDLLWLICGLVYHPLELWHVVNHDTCGIFVTARTFLDVASCLLEVHLALGFAFACFAHSAAPVQMYRGFLLMIPGCYVISAVLLVPAQPWHHMQTLHGLCFTIDAPQWCIIAFCCCGVTVFGYTVSIRGTATKPRDVRRRAWIRGLSYVLSFLLTCGPRAIAGLAIASDLESPRSSTLSFATLAIFSLNGAANIFTYVFWLHRPSRGTFRSTSGRLSRPSLPAVATASSVAGCETCSSGETPHAAVSDTLLDFESMMMDGYFDLRVTDDEATYHAQRRVSAAIAEARQLRTNS